MRLERWQHEGYVTLFSKFGTGRHFRVGEAQELLAYDPSMTYKFLNELEHVGLIESKRSGENWRVKEYKLSAQLNEIPLMDQPIPTGKPLPPAPLLDRLGYGTTSTASVYSGNIGSAYEKFYEPSGRYTAILKKGKYSEVDFVAGEIRKFNVDFTSRAIQNFDEIDWGKVIQKLNSFQKRYLGAVIDLLLGKGYENGKAANLTGRLFEDTKTDGRLFGVGLQEKEPPEFSRTGKKWRVELKISIGEVEVL
ncbi:winged helix-turn-helix transcriptional regulator [Candidatus Micrarchaeota archaeon]|nr:winged helix-turn-helix transcriptional regulator [Candidatus Micrarchaeota archaeon]